jgi:NAD(P)-dependent dehydrogenase (short-subunit alcohol dehydrogenase family)
MATSDTQQTVLITGATSGLGRATAIRLAERGYRVFAGGRSAERLAALEAEARERRLPLAALGLDVTDDASVARAVAQVRGEAGAIDALVNNAGIAIVAPMEEIALDDLRRQFETNFFGAVRVAQQVLPEMRARRRGRIINVSSIAGKLTLPLFGPYSSSKFALEAITDALRLELHPFGIHAVLIEPGYIPTDMENAALALSARYAEGAERSPYAQVYRGFRRSWKQTTREPRSRPEDCARVILRALTDTPPRARYTVTRAARLAVIARRLFSDRALDRRILRSYGLDRVENPGEPG